MAFGAGFSGGGFTSHILFALEDDKRISAVRLALLVALLMGMSVLDDPDLCSAITVSEHS